MINITVNSEFDTTGHSESWRNEVAAELNELLARAEYSLGTSNDETDVAFAKAACSIAARVAGFEEIELVGIIDPSIRHAELECVASKALTNE